MPSSENMKSARVASLTLVNALIFQQILASTNAEVPSLGPLTSSGNMAEEIEKCWNHIISAIDYVPIFEVALALLRELKGTPGFDSALKNLAHTALRITGRRAALRHDLMGRIFHRLLADAKYFGAFYTTVPAAALLLKLTFTGWQLDWANRDAIHKLRIADLACGTGTLLKASVQTIADRHIRACAEQGSVPDLVKLHSGIVEHGLYGLDVVPFAIHLAASALSMHEPGVQFDNMNLYTMPLSGGAKPRLGSIELFSGREKPIQAGLFGANTTAGHKTTGAGDVESRVKIPWLDLCVMNPPFTRSVGGNLLFGNLPKKQRVRMQTALKDLVRERGIPANITAGLGAVFIALGDQLLNEEGTLSLVLPKALLSGVAWEDSRRKLGNQYFVEYVIVSHQNGGWNFSENTKLSECMVVARKLQIGSIATQPTKFINLCVKPDTSIEALALADHIINTPGAPIDGSGVSEIVAGGRKLGEIVSSTPFRVRAASWSEEVAFAQTELARVAYYLTKGQVYIPGKGVAAKAGFTTLKSVGLIGPDIRDITDGFTETTTKTAYRIMSRHDTSQVHSMEQKHSGYLNPRVVALPNRHLRSAELLWSRAGEVMIAERVRLTTAHVSCVRLRSEALGNSWWPFCVYQKDGRNREEISKAIVMWFNSTLGLLTMIATRVETEGPWVKFKKPVLKKLLIPDFQCWEEKHLSKLASRYDTLASKELKPIRELHSDSIRAEIDEAIGSGLRLKNGVAPIRELLASEPLLSAGSHEEEDETEEIDADEDDPEEVDA